MHNANLKGYAGLVGLLLHGSTHPKVLPIRSPNHDAAYRLQSAYFKLWISDKQELTNVLEINDLIPILVHYGIDVRPSSTR